VSVGPLRIHFLLHCSPLVRDVVIAGHDRDVVTALIFPDPANCEHLKSNGGARPAFEALLRTFAAKHPASSTRIERIILLKEPPSLDGGELTEKGTVNQRATLRRRAAFVERLYAQPFAGDVIRRPAR
jgi:feruloyl-CoA synthase